MHEYIKAYDELSKGGEWLSTARTWIQSNVPRGDTLTWNSGEHVSIPFSKLEELALKVAIAAVVAERNARTLELHFNTRRQEKQNWLGVERRR
jgi:hypothetical protein